MHNPKKIIAFLTASVLLSSAVFAAELQSTESFPETDTSLQIPEVVDSPSLERLVPWFSLQSARRLADLEKKREVAKLRREMQEQVEQILSDASLLTPEMADQAVAAALTSAESEMQLALEEAAAAAESEMHLALEEAAATAESEKQQALNEAAAAAESEKQQALEEAAAAAKSEQAQALSQAAAAAEAEMQQALEEAAAAAESEKELALAQAESEMEQMRVQAQSEKEQAISEAQAQWEADQEEAALAEADALYNSHVWTSEPTPIRESSDPDSPVLAVADAGAPVTVTAQDDNAYLVDYYGIEGYVDKDVLDVPESMLSDVKSAPSLQTWCSVTLENQASHLNVREAPGSSSKVVGVLDAEEIVFLTGNFSEDGRWAEILYNSGGSVGWTSVNYLTSRFEGEPDEMTRLIYFAEYDQAAELLRSEDISELQAWKNGTPADPATVKGTATIVSDDWVYSGEVVAGAFKGRGTLLQITDLPGCYIRITGDWDGNVLNGSAVYSFCSSDDPTQDMTIVGTAENSEWERDVVFHAQSKEGRMKYFYGYADHGKIAVLATDSTGLTAVAKSADGEYLYMDAGEADSILQNVPEMN